MEALYRTPEPRTGSSAYQGCTLAEGSQRGGKTKQAGYFLINSLLVQSKYWIFGFGGGSNRVTRLPGYLLSHRSLAYSFGSGRSSASSWKRSRIAQDMNP